MTMSARGRATLLCVLGVLATAWSSQAQAPSSDYLKKAQELVRTSMKPPTFADVRPSTPAPPFKPGLRIAVILAPIAIIGAFLGYRLTKIIPEKAFYRFVEVALFLVSLKLIYDGVLGLTNG